VIWRGRLPIGPKQLEIMSRYNNFILRFARCPASMFVGISITEVMILFVNYRRFFFGWIQSIRRESM